MERNEKFKSELENQYNILIQAQEKSEKRRFMLLFGVVILTFLSVLISTFFAFVAYRNTTKAQSDEASQTNTYYQTLSTVYNNTSSLELNNIVTGYRLSSPKTIQVTNEGDSNVTFNIKLSSVKTSLLSTSNLVYTLVGSDDTNEVALPISDKVILENITLAPNESKTYTLNVHFRGIVDQEDSNNYYNAKIVVEQVNNKSNLLE